MEFAKLHALGNDFLVVKIAESSLVSQSFHSQTRTVCHRNCGVGADGILYYWKAGDSEADIAVRIFNADGSEAGMSGNGVRCLAAHLYRSNQWTAPSLRIRTKSGIKVMSLRGVEGTVYTFEGSMGLPITDPDRIPVRLPSASAPILGYPLPVRGDTVKVTITSMGNPHCSTFWPELDQAPLNDLGPLLEKHSIFPNRTNVEFVQVVDNHQLRVRFWERGVGRTLASGTGSCAAAVAAILHNYAETPVSVQTELGSLVVSWETGREVYLTGPAEFICSGYYHEGAKTKEIN